MKDKPKNTYTIEVVYESSCKAYGDEIIKWLIDEKIAENTTGSPAEGDKELFHYTFTALRPIAADSLIVFVSDEATANEGWHNSVVSASKETRIIPVGSVETIDYNNSEVLPSKIEEINFIHIDENLHKNILDALTTSPDFYSLKNQLLIRCKRWSISHDSIELLTNLKQIKEYKSVLERKSEDEDDPGLNAQLQEIGEYLEASQAYAKKMLFKNIGQWIFRGFVIAAAVLILIAFFVIQNYYSRLSYANLASSVDMNTVDAETGAVKMAEIISNPLSDSYSIKLAYGNLVKLLDKVWPQTPIGSCYKNQINDIAIPSGEQYVWSADAGGRIICWDTYTGQRSYDETVSDSGLTSLSVSGDGQVLAAVDADGIIYVSQGNGWRNIGTLSSVNAEKAEIKTTDDTVLIFDDHSFELYDMNGTSLNSQERSGRTILDIGFLSDKEIIAAESESGVLITEVIDFTNDSSEEHLYENVKTGSLSEADIFKDTVVISDSDGQVWKIADNEAVRTPLLLPKVLGLKLVDPSTVVYHERNIGTGIYDIDDAFDYGDVLSDIRGVNSLYATDSLVVAGGTGAYYVCSIDKVLKTDKSEAQIPSDAVVYHQTEYHPDNMSPDQIGVHSVEISPNGIVIIQVKTSESEELITAVLDPASVVTNSSGHVSIEDTSQIPETDYQYDDKIFTSNDLPSVAGIRYVPADDTHDTDRYYLIIGCRDGSFAELYMAPDGTLSQTVSHTIPSRCAVTAVYQVENGYLIEDESGRLWNCDDGIELCDQNGCFNMIKNKLHSAVSDNLKKEISPEVWKQLELKTYPGGNGEVWE